MTPDPAPLAIAGRLLNAFNINGELFNALRRNHNLQWQLEDATRMPDASPTAISSSKAHIDSCNARRHELIDAIDAEIVGGELAEGPTLYSETLGELCDRLIILDLKQNAIGYTDSPDSRRLAGLCRHLAQLAEQLIADSRARRAALPPRFGTKVYAGREEPTDATAHFDGEATTSRLDDPR